MMLLAVVHQTSRRCRPRTRLVGRDVFCIPRKSSFATRVVSIIDVPRRAKRQAKTQIPGQILMPIGTLREPNQFLFRDWTGALSSVVIGTDGDGDAAVAPSLDASVGANDEEKGFNDETAATQKYNAIVDSLPSFLREENTAIVLHEPTSDVELATGHYQLHLAHPKSVQPWSLPTTVAGYNRLADQSTHPILCAQSAWDLVPQIRRRMAVVLTNLAAATLPHGSPIAAIWYAGTATVLDPTVGHAWKVLVEALEALDLPRTAYHVIQQQTPDDTQSDKQLERSLNPLRNRLGKYAYHQHSNQRPGGGGGATNTMDEVPTCWSQVLPPDPLDMPDLPPQRTSNSNSYTPDDIPQLRQIAKKYFRAGEYEAASEKIRAEWFALPHNGDVVQELSRTMQHLLLERGGDSRYAIASVVLDPNNADAWIRWSDGYAAAGQAAIGCALLRRLLVLQQRNNSTSTGETNNTLRYRMALQRLQEVACRPATTAIPYFPRPGPVNSSMGSNLPLAWRQPDPAARDAYIVEAQYSTTTLRDYVTLLCRNSKSDRYDYLEFLSRRTVPKLHEEFLAKPLPFGLEYDRVRRSVTEGYWNACSHPWQLALPMVTEGELTGVGSNGGGVDGREVYALQRWGGYRARWEYVQQNTLNAGDQVTIRYHEDHPGAQMPVSYNPYLQSMFVNCPSHPAVFAVSDKDTVKTLSTSRTHVSMGCNDLSELLVLWQDDDDSSETATTKSAKKWIGVDQSPFAIARTLVVLELLRQSDVDIASIIQVWYSTVWSTDTLGAFLRACHTLLDDADHLVDIDPAVARYLRFWRDEATPIPGAAGRAKWWDHIEQRPDRLFGRVASFKRERDRKDVLRYLSTGEVLAERNDESEKRRPDTPEEYLRASLVYWSLPPEDFLSLEYGNIFCTMPFPEVDKRMELYDKKDGYSTHSVMDCIIDIKTEQLTNLRQRLQRGQLAVELRLGTVSAEISSLPFMKDLIEVNPDAVSWSNLCDFVDSPSEFHALASVFENATHYGYTMNWTTTTYGCCISDYLSSDKDQADTTDVGHVDEILRTALASHNDRALLFQPSFETPLNHASYELAGRVQKSWLQHFFAATEGSVPLLQRVVRLDRFPLYRSNTPLYITWNYEEAHQDASPNSQF